MVVTFLPHQMPYLHHRDLVLLECKYLCNGSISARYHSFVSEKGMQHIEGEAGIIKGAVSVWYNVLKWSQNRRLFKNTIVRTSVAFSYSKLLRFVYEQLRCYMLFTFIILH